MIAENKELQPITINKDEILILKLEQLFHPRVVKEIRNDIIKQVEAGVVMIPKGMEYTICKRGCLENESRMINVDTWIDKLNKIVNDPEAPGEYADYCMCSIAEIEAEFQAQQQEGE